MRDGHIDRGSTAISRRAVLGAGVGFAALLAGCTNTSGSQGGGATQGGTDRGSFQIPNNSIINTPVSLQCMDSGDQKAKFWEPFFKAYHGVHDNVTVAYTGTNWNTIQQSITLGLQNGNAPDIFQLPGTISAAAAVKQGWLAAFDDLIPDFKKLMSAYPPGTIANGVNIFDGKTYTISPSSNQRMSWLTLSNSDLVADTGVDLNVPVSWDNFRSMLKKVTQNGKGKYYGIIAGLAQSAQLSQPIGAMAELAGCPGDGGGFNWKTGQYNFTDQRVADAIELFLSIKSDGSFFPGSVSLDAPGARGRFPQGVAGVILQGPWNIRAWLAETPSLKLGVGLLPLQDPSQSHMVSFDPGGSNGYVINAKSKSSALKVAGDMFSYVMSKNGQMNWAELDGTGDPAAYPGMQGQVTLDQEKIAARLAAQKTAIAPNPASRNPDVAIVTKNLKQVEPGFSATCVGLFTGQITGVKAVLKTLSDASEKALDEAIAAAKKEGAKVSRDDWVFPDWNPDQPYEKLYNRSN
jgi:multiple sugar transport system substrate-binding protein